MDGTQPLKKFVIVKADHFKKKEMQQLSKFAARQEYISTDIKSMFVFFSIKIMKFI